jgi:signal transduction histidine kinase
MIKPSIPENEEERIKELHKFKIMDSEFEKDFDNIVELASLICDVPISLVTLLDGSRQWFKAKKGINVRETSRDISFCGHAINQNDMFIVEDTSEDERFSDNPLVVEAPHIRFYAGMPLRSENGFNLGTLCVIDSKPKKLSANQKRALEILSNQVTKLIELRDKKNQLQDRVHYIDAQNEKLESLNKLNSETTNIISHDMRGPIASILSYFNTEYFNNSDPEEVVKLFPFIKESIQGIHSLIENLLEWSQSAGDFEVKVQNLQQLSNEVINIFQAQAQKKSINLHTDIKDNIEVMADTSMLRFILRNLVNNAIKFTEDGVVLISAKKEDDNLIKIVVQDTGIGIDAELKERISKGDKKISTTGTQKEKGSGLGLRLIKEFLNRHHSTLIIESEKNVGSTFSFVLPTPQNNQ